MITKKKIEVSPITILLSIEKDLKDMIPEINKGLKPKIISIQESIKLLQKRLTINPIQQTSQIQSINFKEKLSIEQSNHKEEYKNKLEEELNFLKNENTKLKSDLSHSNHILTEKNKTIHSNDSMINEIRFILNEEKTKNNLLLLQVKTVEDNFKTLNNEYQALSQRHENVLKEMQTISQATSDMKRTHSDNRYCYEDLAQINSELKKKLLSYEATIMTHTDDLKNTMKKNAILKSKNEELEKANKVLIAEVNYKEERIKAIRIMNSKLENNSKRLLSKWESLSKIEEKNLQISNEANEAFDSLREMNARLIDQSAFNQQLQLKLHDTVNDNILLQKEIQELKGVNQSAKVINKELINKNQQLEYNLQDNFHKKEAKVLASSYISNNNIFPTSQRNDTDHSYNEKEAITLDELQPAKFNYK